MKISFLKEAKNTDVAVVVGVYEENELTSAAKFLDETTAGLVQKAIDSNRFKGKLGQVISLIAPNDLKIRRLLIAGLGKKEEACERTFEEFGGHVYHHLMKTPDQEVVFHLGDLAAKGLKAGEVAARVAHGCHLKSWRFDKYKTTEKAEEKPALATISVITEEPDVADKAHVRLDAIAQGVFLSRALASEPGNELYPEVYANWIAKELKPLGVEVEILDVPAMEKLGMHSLLGVGVGSDKPSRVVIMQYNGGKKGDQPISFVGKGVTFDSGGISIKPSSFMEEMKFDMCGSAVVVALMKTLALQKAPVNVVGTVGIVENMPSGKAQRPGDIVKSMSGQTIEIINTDAEGRLVLADVLWYTQDRFKPKFMVDLATLTGAILIGLGDVNAGLFSNNDEIAGKIFDAGQKTGETVWRMPMGNEYYKQMSSDCADIRNANNGRKAGSITAAEFLKKFINDCPWAHLDIAGTAYIHDRDLPLCQRGPTAFGVRLLERFVHDNYL